MTTDQTYIEPTEVVTQDGGTALISAFRGHDDALVVQIDTPLGHRHIRVNLNDGTLFDGNPDTDEPRPHA